MAPHRLLIQRTAPSIYFIDRHRPWKRGIYEDTNGPPRQYFPEGTNPSICTQQQLDRIAYEFNTRPRASLRDRHPAFVFMRELGLPDIAEKLQQEIKQPFDALRNRQYRGNFVLPNKIADQ